jgi:hypothetical protein
MFEKPAQGDVLITSENGRHLLSVVPHPHRLALSDFPTAMQIARQWAHANNVNVWRSADGELAKVALD